MVNKVTSRNGKCLKTTRTSYNKPDSALEQKFIGTYERLIRSQEIDPVAAIKCVSVEYCPYVPFSTEHVKWKTFASTFKKSGKYLEVYKNIKDKSVSLNVV